MAKLLSGGNPQIAKGDGDAPVQAYIAAMPGWKRDIGRRIDAIITRNVRGVRKAVKWNSPFYGVEGQGWFLAFHVFTRYVKVTFFKGTSLEPVPPGASKHDEVRYADIHEGAFDEKQFASWVKQAAALPGWDGSSGTSKERKPRKDWQEGTLDQVRAAILAAAPGIVEERKWKKPSNGMAGIPVWSHNGIICTGETYTKVVKLTFANGASLPDPSHLFNASLEGNTRRAIDIREGEKVNARALTALVKAAAARNDSVAKRTKKTKTRLHGM